MKKTKMERKIYRYEFASGDGAELILGDKWRRILEALDHGEQRQDRREDRNCLSLDLGLDSGEWLIDMKSDPADKVCMKETIESMNEGIDHLTRSQKETARAICLEDMGITEFACSKGITQEAVSQRIGSVRKRIKKFM